MSNKQICVKINLRPDKDDDLIAALARIPKTERSAYFRRIWRASLTNHTGTPARIDLSAIRQIVESALDSRLTGLVLAPGEASEAETDPLDQLDDSFLLE